MTTKKNAVTEQTLREQESLRLHIALSNTEPGSDAYTKILAQISALNAHTRAVELKDIDAAQDAVSNRHAVDIEYVKQNYAVDIERSKQAAAYKQKQVDVIAKIVVIGAILVFESSGHAIITKAFGLIRD